MEIIYYTIAAIILYGISDYILNSIEIRIGKRLPNRSLVFLVIITILSLVSFSVIRTVIDQKQSVQQTTNIPDKQTDKKPASTQVLPNEKESKK